MKLTEIYNGILLEEEKLFLTEIDLLNEDFSSILKKVGDYAKKGLLTTAMITSLMSSQSFSQEQESQIKQAAQTEASAKGDLEGLMGNWTFDSSNPADKAIIDLMLNPAGEDGMDWDNYEGEKQDYKNKVNSLFSSDAQIFYLMNSGGAWKFYEGSNLEEFFDKATLMTTMKNIEIAGGQKDSDGKITKLIIKRTSF